MSTQNSNFKYLDDNYKPGKDDIITCNGNTYPLSKLKLHAELNDRDGFPPEHYKIYSTPGGAKKILLGAKYSYTNLPADNSIELTDFFVTETTYTDYELAIRGFKIICDNKNKKPRK